MPRLVSLTSLIQISRWTSHDFFTWESHPPPPLPRALQVSRKEPERTVTTSLDWAGQGHDKKAKENQTSSTYIIGPPLPRPLPASLLFQFLSSCFLKSLSKNERKQKEIIISFSFFLCLKYMYMNKLKPKELTTTYYSISPPWAPPRPSQSVNFWKTAKCMPKCNAIPEITGAVMTSNTVEILSMSERQTILLTFSYYTWHFETSSRWRYSKIKQLIFTVIANIAHVSICEICFHNVRIINNFSKME